MYSLKHESSEASILWSFLLHLAHSHVLAVAKAVRRKAKVKEVNNNKADERDDQQAKAVVVRAARYHLGDVLTVLLVQRLLMEESPHLSAFAAERKAI